MRSFALMLILVSWICTWADFQVAPDHSFIQYQGRWDFSNPKKPRCDWPGSGIQLRFTGPSIKVSIQGGNNDFNVFIDNRMVKHLSLKNDSTLYSLAENLPGKEHSLLLTKRTEGRFGITTFSGIVLEKGQKLLAPPAKSKKRIQFIGDSFIVGLGNEGPAKPCPDSRHFDNNALAYGPISASVLGLDYSVQAISGIGIIHNNSDTLVLSSMPMPAYFGRTLFGIDSLPWDFQKWIPDYVVIGLGINDLLTEVRPFQSQYISSYKKFILQLKAQWPRAEFICVGYPVENLEIPYLEKLVDEFTQQGFKQFHILKMPSLNSHDLGCNSHPNANGHQKYAAALISFIQNLPQK